MQSVWENKNIQFFSDFPKWYNNKDVVPTLEVLQERIESDHSKGIDMLKPGCTLPNLANTCLHKSTVLKLYASSESDKGFLVKIRKDIDSGPSFVFTRKAVVDDTCIRKSSNLCKSIVGIDASQLYPSFHLQCANQSLLDCIRDGSTILKLGDSQLAETNLAPLRIWFCDSFNEVGQNAGLRVMSLLVDKRKLIASV